MKQALLRIEDLTKMFRSRGRQVAALDSISFDIAAGETLGIVGASGSGKSTLSRVLLRLVAPDRGRITFENEDWLAHRPKILRQKRARMQMVFQDTLASFHPTVTVEQALAEPLRIHAMTSPAARGVEVGRLLDQVELSESFRSRPVRSLSGGQRQRVAIARAIATRPALLVLDEAVSALDPTVREKILGLLVRLQNEIGMSYLFISHDLAVIRALAHRIAVMDAGRIAEIGQADEVISRPVSNAARTLIAAVPRLHDRSTQKEPAS